MPQRKSHRSQRKRRNNNSPPPLSATGYNGPSVVPRNQLDRVESTRQFIRSFNTITSSAAGVISPVYSNSDVRTLGIQFSSYANLFSEYRVLSIHVRYVPIVEGATTNVLINGQVIAHGSNRKSLATATTYTDVTELGDCVLTSGNMPWTHIVKAKSPDEMNFSSVGADPASTFSVRTFGSGYANSTVFANTLITYCVEFAIRS